MGPGSIVIGQSVIGVKLDGLVVVSDGELMLSLLAISPGLYLARRKASFRPEITSKDYAYSFGDDIGEQFDELFNRQLTFRLTVQYS